MCDFLFQKSQIFKVNPMGWGHFPKCRARLDYNQGPLLWDHPSPFPKKLKFTREYGQLLE